MIWQVIKWQIDEMSSGCNVKLTKPLSTLEICRSLIRLFVYSCPLNMVSTFDVRQNIILWNLFCCAIFYHVYCALFYIENDAEIFPVHYTWKVAEKGFKISFMMKKLAMINYCKIILEKQNIFFAKNHCEIQVSTMLVCTLYSIKYNN